MLCRSPHFETMRNYCFRVFCRGVIIQGFLRWCRISSISGVFYLFFGGGGGVSDSRVNQCGQKTPPDSGIWGRLHAATLQIYSVLSRE